MYQSYLEYPLSNHFTYKLNRKHKEPYTNPDDKVLPNYNSTNRALPTYSNAQKIYPTNTSSYPSDDTTFLKQFCQDTTVHGLGYAGNLRITKFERILWGIIFLVTSVFLFFTMGKFFLSDNSVLTTVIQNASYSIADIPFPSITLCRSSNFNWTRYKEAESIFLPKNASTKMKSNFKKFLIIYYDVPFANVDIHEKPSKPITLNLEDLKELDFLNVKDIFDFMAWTCEENFDNCFWHGVNMSCCKLFRRKYTEKGLCFSFNSISNSAQSNNLYTSTTKGDSGALHIHLKDDRIFEFKENKRSKRSTLKNSVVTLTGDSGAGLGKRHDLIETEAEVCSLDDALCLNTSLYKKQLKFWKEKVYYKKSSELSPKSKDSKSNFPLSTNKTPSSDRNSTHNNSNNAIESNKISASARQKIFDPLYHPWLSEFYVGGEHGSILSINEPLETPSPKAFLNHGSSGIFVIVPTYYSSHKEIKYVSSSVRQCLFQFEIKDPLYSTLPDHAYNLENCHQECKRQNTLKLCKCIPDIYYPAENYPRCKPSDYKCLVDNTVVLNNIVKIATKDNRTKACVCYCMSACNRIKYEITENIDRGPPPHARKSNQIIVNILYGVDTFIKYETSLSKNLLDYLVYYGGIASFFLGCSLLSVFEVIYYFTIRLIVYLSYKIRYKNIR